MGDLNITGEALNCESVYNGVPELTNDTGATLGAGLLGGAIWGTGVQAHCIRREEDRHAYLGTIGLFVLMCACVWGCSSFLICHGEGQAPIGFTIGVLAVVGFPTTY